MKRIFLFLLLLAALAFAMLPLARSAQSPGDVLLSVKDASGPLAPAWVTKTNSRALGWDSSGNLTAIPVTASVTWGSLTGTLASQTDLQTALDAKASTASLSSYLTTASAASTYASLSGSYANPAWITSLAWSKLSGTPTTLAGYGITDALTTATAASTYAPLASPTFTGTISGASLSLSGGISVNGSIATGAGNFETSVGNISTGTGTISGNGSGITALNASNISTGTLAAARLADGSIGLAKLASLPMQAETLTYYNAVLAAGGSISLEVLMLLDELIADAKQNSWWDNILEAYPFCTDGFTGVFVKLKAASGAPASLINNSFVAADYTRGTGFGVDASNSSKWLQTGVTPSSLGYDRTNIGLIASITSETVTLGGASGRTIGDMISGNAGECGIYFQHWSNSMVVGNGTYQGYQALNPTARVISFQSSGSLHHTCADGIQYTSWTQTTTGTLTGEITLFRVTRFSANRYETGRLGFTAITSYMTPAEAKAATAAIAKFERRIRTIYGRESPGIILWGDSITATQGATSTNDGFAPLVARRLGLRPVNHGIPSAWLTANSGPLAAVNQVTDILAQPERTILMMFGCNDVQYSVTDSTYNTHLTTICAAAQTARRRLVLCTPSYSSNSSHQTTLRAYASRLATAAITYGFPFADTNIAGADNPQQADTVHPNTAGHLQMADVITAAMRGVQLRRPTIDLGSLAAGATTSGTLTMLTARAGQSVTITPPATWDAGMILKGYVSANDTVTYTVTNTTGGSIDEESGVFTFTVGSPQ